MAYIDHYDSFTANLIDWLHEGTTAIEVEKTAFDDLEKMSWIRECELPLVLSPGPKSPNDALSTLDLLRKKLGKVPIFGVCLGHQMLGTVLGGRIVCSTHAFHGEARTVIVDDDSGFFRSLPREFKAGVYHSLVLQSEGLREGATVVAHDVYGECQAMEYRVKGEVAALGVQFHPESFLSDELGRLRENWLRTFV